ncbi:MAG: ABC transporter ATP-binding protein [Candidatus Elarobacter sp.]
MSWLEVRDLRVSYGDFAALQGVSLDVERGDIVAIVGANGAGKSTTLKALAGLVPTAGGTIAFDGRRTEGCSARTLVDRGMAMTLEGRQLFPEMTVEDNLLAGAEIGRSRSNARANLAGIYDRLGAVRDRRRQLAGTLSGGEQQMVAIGRSMMSEPSLLLLDEPSLGLAPRIVADIFAWIRDINRNGPTVVLVEQNSAASLVHASRAYVRPEGRVAMSGAAAEIARDEGVRAAYLGGGSATA